MTDVSNASRTLLFNIHTLEWDNDLLELFDIPKAMLPEVKESSTIYGETSTTLFATKIPIAGVAGDQQAALFGQLCTNSGMVKNTYGTGCFMLMNTGEKPIQSTNNLLTTIAWKINGKTTYALEGSVFVGGAAVQWLRDGAKMINSSEEIEALASSVPDNGGVYFVPALTGLGAPYWDQYARGAMFGITRGTTNAHIARATLEGIAYQVNDLVKAMEADFGDKGKELRVDGGAATNNLLMQFQSDIFGSTVTRPKTLETTALGAAYLAGLAVGYWADLDDLKEQWSIDKVFSPEMEEKQVNTLVKNWDKAVSRASNWIEE
jgi:glycerol kinase